MRVALARSARRARRGAASAAGSLAGARSRDGRVCVVPWDGEARWWARRRRASPSSGRASPPPRGFASSAGGSAPGAPGAADDPRDDGAEDPSSPASAPAAPPPPGWSPAAGAEDAADPDGSVRRALEIAIDRTGLFRAIEEAHGDGALAEEGRKLSGLEAHLASIIKFRGGPITVAEYMQEVLTHPEFGYYMHRDVFGAEGDFVTSPEVSQVFGELMGAWAVYQWTQMGKPDPVRLVELGPGRGTLMADALRASAVFAEFARAVRVHLVEVSPKLRQTQREKLRCGGGERRGGEGEPPRRGGEGEPSSSPKTTSRAAAAAPSSLDGVAVARNPMMTPTTTSRGDAGDPPADPGPGPGPAGGALSGGVHHSAAPPVDRGVSALNGAPVEWHETLDSVPGGPTILIAHEFFDAMPVHQFTRTERGWCERLVALRGDAPRRRRRGEEEEEEGGGGGAGGAGVTTGAGSASADDSRDDDDGDEGREGALEMVLSPGLTPAGALMIPRRLEGMPEATKQGLRQLEISPRALAVWERIAERLEAHGGAALAIDYGEEGPLGDSLRAIKDHAFVPPLRDPGAADLSAYVDFGAMRRVIETREPSEGAVGGGVECYGPIPQRDLLFGLGIQERLERLVGECETEEQAEKVYVACERLVGGDDAAAEGGGGEGAARAPGMGFRYKALAMVSKGTGVPAGFQR